MEASTFTTDTQHQPSTRQQAAPSLAVPAERGGELPLEEQKHLRFALMQAEAPALYGDNNNRVTQRNYLLLGIFIVFSSMLTLAIQNDSRHHYALVYNIIIFFMMLLWTGNTEKMGRQNGEILGLEKRANYSGIQTQRAAQRHEQRVITVPKKIVSLAGTSKIVVPTALAIRWGKQYWGTVGLVLSTDCIMLYLSGTGKDLLSITALLFTLAIPMFITHDRPTGKHSTEENQQGGTKTHG